MIPRSRRSPGEGNGNQLQYSCLGNPMDRGAWWAEVHGVAESDITKWLTHSTCGCAIVFYDRFQDLVVHYEMDTSQNCIDSLTFMAPTLNSEPQWHFASPDISISSGPVSSLLLSWPHQDSSWSPFQSTVLMINDPMSLSRRPVCI